MRLFPGTFVIELVPSRTYLSEQSRCGENAWLLRGLRLPRINICQMGSIAFIDEKADCDVLTLLISGHCAEQFTKWLFFFFSWRNADLRKNIVIVTIEIMSIWSVVINFVNKCRRWATLSYYFFIVLISLSHWLALRFRLSWPVHARPLRGELMRSIFWSEINI